MSTEENAATDNHINGSRNVQSRVYFISARNSTRMDVNQDLEVQYSPSCFTKRFATRDEVLHHHIDFVKKGSLSFANKRVKLTLCLI
jgi:hypothetical protein